MNKKFLARSLYALALVTAAVLYLLSVCVPAVVKKFKIFGGAILLICGVVCAVFAYLLPENLVVPIIVLVVAVAILLGIFATGGKKWDEGDNQKIGYENYHQRKAREEKENEQK